MKFRCLIATLALTIVATDSLAGPFRRRAQPSYQPTYQGTYQPSYPSSYPPYAPISSTPVPAEGIVTDAGPSVTPSGVVTAGYSPVAATAAPVMSPDAYGLSAGDGLDEVNAKRAAAGLRPYLRDEGLAAAARGCAEYRAAYGLFGHTNNDFGFVPPGTSASSAGCAAYPAGYGWMSCCTYDNYTYAGAAWVTGRDGKRYMHLFVR
jgi:hypothetical protein